MSPLDRTARRRLVIGEAEKAARRGLAETAREALQRTVRTAAALAHDETDFLDRLQDAGGRVRERLGDDGTLLGYSVALPGDRADRGSRPVWFAGSTLAYDLSLPRVRERFTPSSPRPTGRSPSTASAKRPNSWAGPGRTKAPVTSQPSATWCRWPTPSSRPPARFLTASRALLWCEGSAQPRMDDVWRWPGPVRRLRSRRVRMVEGYTAWFELALCCR
ncbi:hypothetical protein [Streptomyces erythrochromogenes]|uniref:hypothetical protein n=1 Tax=Streptomyces erythrochromogenes TaxID=285574 RepID=UPI0036FB03D3